MLIQNREVTSPSLRPEPDSVGVIEEDSRVQGMWPNVNGNHDHEKGQV